MLSQFVGSDMNKLSNLDFDFPEGTHAIGRLDNESEGLLILTTNKKVTRLLFQSEVPHKRSYLVKVKHTVEQKTLDILKNGIRIEGRKGIDYTTEPCDIEIVEKPEYLFANPYEMPDYVSYTWLRITLSQGKYHQIRKMVYAVNHKCKRLIRTSIEDLQLTDLEPGKVREIDEQSFFTLLKINY
jgi:23S rRNA pseudouridine2457 synthase